MINENFVSNTVILSDMIKALLSELEEQLGITLKFAKLSLNDETFVQETIRRESGLSKKTHNILLTCSFFLESCINTYGYSFYEKRQANAPDEEFENFINKSTVKKWQQFIVGSDSIINSIKDIFEFRNFLVHSKPIRIKVDRWEVYSKYQGWINPSKLTSYLENQNMGLLLNKISPQKLNFALETLNQAIDHLEVLSPNYFRHYQVKIHYKDTIRALEKFDMDFAEMGAQLVKNRHR